MKRRSFLQAMLAASAAPAIISSGILMPVREIITPDRPRLLLLPMRDVGRQLRWVNTENIFDHMRLGWVMV